MLFPVIVHKDPHSSYGVTIPDLPGCFTAGDTLDEALRNLQEAVELHLEGEEHVPSPSPIDRWARDPDFADGIFALVDVDLDFLADETIRVNISAKRSVLARIDRAAKSAGEDRSEFLVRAALERAAATVSAPAAAEPRARYATKGTLSLGKLAKKRRR
jgi:predicted RNase H-like HicB family nuclease